MNRGWGGQRPEPSLVRTACCPRQARCRWPRSLVLLLRLACWPWKVCTFMDQLWVHTANHTAQNTDGGSGPWSGCKSVFGSDPRGKVDAAGCPA